MISENDPVNLTELAAAMRCSRQTVYNWVTAGYEPEFGSRTTVAHCKDWLRTVYAPMINAKRNAKRRERQEYQERLLKEMAGARTGRTPHR